MDESNHSVELQKPRLHVALRIFLFLVASIFGIGLFQSAGMRLAEIVELTKQNQEPSAIVKILMELLSLIPLFFVTFMFRKYLDRKTFLSLGFSFKNRIGDFLFGLAVAAILYIFGSGVLLLTGNIEFSKLGISVQTLLISFISFIVVAIMEELMMRGYVLNNLLSVTNRYIALLISSVLFAALHSMNPGLSWLAMLNLLLAGVLLGSAYIFTRNLWFALSLHLFWNFIQGPVLGYRVSGNITESFLSAKPLGNPILSGGDFGFEGSIVCTILSAALALAIILFYERRSKREEVKDKS